MIDVDLAKRIADLVDGDVWQLADLLADEFPPEQWPEDPSGRSGLHAELREYELTLAREYGVLVKATTMRHYRATALAWPRGKRFPRASFTVHLRMKGPGREAEMAKRLRQAKAEKRALSEKMLRRFRADENPKPGISYEVRMRRAITNAVRREMLGGVLTKQPDWWMTAIVVQQSRDVAIRELRHLADAIEAGEIRGEV